MAGKSSNPTADQDQQLPPDAKAINELLSSMGVTEYEPKVIEQLLNFMYRHVADILQDADAYRQRLDASGEIDMEDLLLAIQSREAHNFVQPPAQSVIADLAAQRNKQPLPELSDKPGLIIPTNSLLGPSYQLNVSADEALPAADSQPSSVPPINGDSRPTSKRKQQIAVNISQAMDEG